MVINIISFFLILIFYLSYILKMLKQRKKGIKTNVMVKGKKEKKTKVIGTFLMFFTYFMALVQFASCFLGKYLFPIELISGLRISGLVLIGLGDWFFITAFLTMKDSWRAGIDIEQKTSLVTTGIYKISRNPAFVGFDLMYIGSSLATCNVIIIILSLLCIIIMHFQIKEEERFLENEFKDEYLNYKKTVRRYL